MSSGSSNSSALDPASWQPVVLRKERPPAGETTVKGPISLAKTEVSTEARSTGNKAEGRPLSREQWKTLSGAEDVTDAKKVVTTVSRTLGAKIAQARAGKGLKRSQLARTLSIRETELGGWENGISLFNAGLLTKINRALGTQLKKTD
jgi:ribosome-binding protein aMBF1 (putative translation factor)